MLIKTKNLTQVGMVMLSGRELQQFLSDRECSLQATIRDYPDKRDAARAELKDLREYRKLTWEKASSR